MEIASTISAVVNQLKNLFKNRDRLQGFDDWDRFIGCILALENIAMQLSEQEETEETTGE